MAKKADLIKQATDMGLEASDKLTIAQLEELISSADTKTESPVDSSDDKPTAKAGKRSAKGIEQSEKKTAKIEKQHHRDEDAEGESAKPAVPVKPTRSKLERRSKAYRQAAQKVESKKTYTLKEALDLAIQTSTVKFDAGIEIHVRLNVDPRHADQNLRDTVILPAGTGKKARVAVFADDAGVAAAKKAGADIAAGEEFLQQLDKGIIEFDVLVSTPQMMAKLGKYARVLGPKGLMPNPKSGTVATDVAKAVTESKAGRVEYRVDSTGIVHVGVGKASFGVDKLKQNVDSLLSSLRSNKPASIKGTFVKSIFVASTMGPGIQVANSEL